jgi:hypothetical protein
MFISRCFRRSAFAVAATEALLRAGSLSWLGQTAVGGAIGGTVEDKTGAIISRASIVIHDNGLVIHLHPGFYTVTMSAALFDQQNIRFVHGIVYEVIRWSARRFWSQLQW